MSNTQTQSTPERKSLLSQKYKFLQQSMDKFVKMMCSNAYHAGGVSAPKMGFYSLVLESTPVFVYDHPALRAIADTAFTDGVRIFFDAQFFASLLYEDAKNGEEGNPTETLVPLMLHELTHIVLGHAQRGYYSDIILKEKSRAASDADAKDKNGREILLSSDFYDAYISMLAREHVVNAQVVAFLKDLRSSFGQNTFIPGRIFEGGIGTSEKDADRFFGLSEPQVEQILRKERPPPDADGNADESGSQSSKGSRKAGAPSAAQGGGESAVPDIDHISSEALAQHLEQMLAKELIDELGLEPSADSETHEAQRQKAKDRVLTALQKMQQIRRENGDAAKSIPGAHQEDYLERQIQVNARGKMSWRTAMRSAILGSGARYEYTEDVIAPEFFVDPLTLGSNVSPYAGVQIPAKNKAVALVLIDTSGSMGDGAGLLTEIGNEVAGLARDVAGQIRVAIIPADTCVRGEVVEVPEEEMEALSSIRTDGGGGTDFSAVINQALMHYESMAEEVAHIVYFTDLCDIPPDRSNLPERLPPITFVTTPVNMNEDFARSVASYADVVMIEDQAQIELAAERERAQSYTPSAG